MKQKYFLALTILSAIARSYCLTDREIIRTIAKKADIQTTDTIEQKIEKIIAAGFYEQFKILINAEISKQLVISKYHIYNHFN